ncbi:type VI secretion system baseplate subunit TssG [Chryseolinea sp. T2]|uniref:type VI secretion system baseplate subunit TssG n=1 Tax=Chryseolinea sp. T2 TaxID=3129255 RepID=UPI0030776CB9
MLWDDDIRIETLIACWLENGLVYKDDILIKPKGTFERSFGRDVSKVEPVVHSPGERVTVHVNREGLYDMLPEGLFHQAKRRMGKTTEESVQQTVEYNREEKEARKVFLPLEQEFYHQKVSTEQAELSACLGSLRSDHINAFIQFWDLPGELLTYEQKNFMLALLPQIHRIAGNREKIARCLEILLDENVTIRGTERRISIDGDGLASLLGNTTLGVDAVLFADGYEDDEALEVQIGPIELDELHRYLSGGEKDQLLRRLYSFFFQAEDEVTSTIVLKEYSGRFLLSEEDYTSRLGFTTVLS